MTNLLWWIFIGWWWIPIKWVSTKFYKKRWFWVIILIIGIFSLIGNNKPQSENDKDNRSVIENIEITNIENKVTEEKEPGLESTSIEPVRDFPQEEQKVNVKEENTKPTQNNQNNFDYENNAPPVSKGTDYVLNSNTMKFHYPRCSSVEKIKIKHRIDYTGTRDEVIEMGYDPCGRCHP